MNMSKSSKSGGESGGSGGASVLANVAGAPSGIASKVPAVTEGAEPASIVETTAPKTVRRRRAQSAGESDSSGMPDYGRAPKPSDYEWDEDEDEPERQPQGKKGKEDAGETDETGESGESGEDDQGENAAAGKGKDKGDNDAISDDLLERAVAAGLSISEAREHGDAKSLERTLKIMERTAGKPAGDGKQDKAEGKADEPEMTEADLLKWDEEFDERIVGKFKDLHTYHTKRYSVLESKLAGIEGALQAQRNAEVEREVDGEFDALDKGFEPLFGKGASGSLEKSSKFWKNRVKVAQEMNTIALGLRAQGKPLPSTKVLFERALRSAFGDQAERTARDKVIQQSRDQSGRFTNPPSTNHRRHESNLTPRQRAQAAVDRVLRDKGFTEGPSDSEDERESFL